MSCVRRRFFEFHDQIFNHRALHSEADDRQGLEQLCRYISRPAISNDGQFLSYVLVPRPRLHLTRFHGVLAPNAKLRSKVVPGNKPAAAHSEEQPCAHSAPVRMSWARLLRRVFDIDIKHCECGGKLKFIAIPSSGSGQALRRAQDRPFVGLRTGIEQPEVIEKILTHLGLSPQPPPIAPARRNELFEAA